MKGCAEVNIRYWRSARWAAKKRAGHVLGRGEVWGYLAFSVDKMLLLRYVPWTGYTPVMLTGAKGSKEVLREYPVWEVREMKRRDPAQVAVTPSGSSLVNPVSTVFMKLTNITKQCSVVKYDDGGPRQPGTLMIGTQGSMWRASVTEPDECLKLVMISAELDDVLAGLELALGSESIPWEIDTYAMSRRPRKKK